MQRMHLAMACEHADPATLTVSWPFGLRPVARDSGCPGSTGLQPYTCAPLLAATRVAAVSSTANAHRQGGSLGMHRKALSDSLPER